MNRVDHIILLALFMLFSCFGLGADLSLGGGEVTHLREGLLSMNNEGAATVNYDLEIGAEHVTHDVIQFKYSVPLFVTSLSSLPSQFSCDRLSADSDVAVFGYLDEEPDLGVIRYRLVRTSNGSATPEFSTIGLHCVTPIVELDPFLLADAGHATLTVKTMTQYGQEIESVGPVNVAKVTDAYSISVDTPFDEIVDVATDKRSFVGATVDNSSDALGLRLTLANGVDGDLLAKNVFNDHSVLIGTASTTSPASSGIITTINGDFSFLDTDQVAGGMQLGDNTVSLAHHTISFPPDLMTLTATNYNPNIVTGVNNFTLEISKGDAAGQLIEQTYTGQLQVYYDQNLQSVTLPLTAGAGEWGWNGTEVMVYALPFGENTTRLLGVSNQGNYEFNVTAEVHSDGSVFGPYILGSVNPKTVAEFGSKLDDEILNSGDDIGSSRANVVIRASVSTANLMVFGGYRLDSDLTLVNLKTSAQPNLITP